VSIVRRIAGVELPKAKSHNGRFNPGEHRQRDIRLLLDVDAMLGWISRRVFHPAPHGDKILLPPHVKIARCNVMNKAGMFNLSVAASQTLANEALRVSADANAGPMTLSERVQALFEQLHITVFRYVMRKTKDSGRAEEITQETFLRLFRYLKEGRSVDNPKAWLFTVANNLAIDASRGDSRIQDLDETTWKRIEDTRLGTADPEKLALQRERLDRLRIVVLNLTPLQRDCLHLRAEGLRYREIAELMNISISTVADAVRRAALKLSREFDNGVSS
jgi:RNA polymerase sigma-70 factor (ECF subfamily)